MLLLDMKAEVEYVESEEKEEELFNVGRFQCNGWISAIGELGFVV